MSTPGTSLYVNADWSALVPAGSVEAAFGIDEPTAKRLGLLDKEPEEVIPKPETVSSANVIEATKEPAEEAEPPDEPEAKQADKPPNKAARKPRNK